MDTNGIDGVMLEIFQELNRARTKHPQWPRDMVHAAAVVQEESGELIRASLRASYEQAEPADARKEAVQTAAMAIRFILNYDQVYPRAAAQCPDGPTSPLVPSSGAIVREEANYP